MPYEDLVREALCFGWVDSLIKRLDDDRYAIKVTPRKPKSKWSDLNRKRWKELEAAGLLAAPGLAAAPPRKQLCAKAEDPELPAYIATAFKSELQGLAHFPGTFPDVPASLRGLDPYGQATETRERRIRQSIELLCWPAKETRFEVDAIADAAADLRLAGRGVRQDSDRA
jgi:hypothetical protein